MTTVITTGGRPDEQSYNLAKEASHFLGYEVVERKKRSVSQLQKAYTSDIIVAGKNRYDLYRIGGDEPFFFHPNSAAFRLKRLVNGEEDPLLEAAQLASGDSFLDCTLGLASDSIIASYIIGDSGRILGVEADRDVAYIVRQGLKSFQTYSENLEKAMARVQVVNGIALDFLREEQDNSWDIVYIDPMFHAPIEESSNFTALRQVGAHIPFTSEWMEEAFRVSKKGVVLKDRFDSQAFEKFGFDRKRRPNTKFHFGFRRK